MLKIEKLSGILHTKISTFIPLSVWCPYSNSQDNSLQAVGWQILFFPWRIGESDWLVKVKRYLEILLSSVPLIKLPTRLLYNEFHLTTSPFTKSFQRSFIEQFICKHISKQDQLFQEICQLESQRQKSHTQKQRKMDLEFKKKTMQREEHFKNIEMNHYIHGLRKGRFFFFKLKKNIQKAERNLKN